MKRSYLVGTLVFVLFMVLVVVVALALHLDGIRLILFIGIMALVAAGAIVAVIIMRRKSGGPAEVEAGTAETVNLDALVRSAEARLKASPGAAKSLAAIPLVYVLGDENSAKTQTILQSGLDAELLAGEVYRDNLVAPTQLTNIWYTGSGAMVEAGSPLLRTPVLWRRLIRLTQPNKLGSALSRGGLQPTRAAMLCISIERIMTSTPEQIRILGQTLNERLRLLSETLGISLPVYVLFTKLDTIPSFADYAANLTEDEARQPLGALLARIDAGAGLYSERATQQSALRFDELTYSLSEFRTEILSRGGQPENLARSYEFPRELRKLRASIVDFLVEAGRPSRLAVNPFLRGFYFSGIRAHVVEEIVNAAASAPVPQQPVDPGATRIFSFNAGAAQPAAQAPRRETRRVPQWVFLPRLLPRIVMADRSALDTSRASTKVNFVKRALIVAAASCLALYILCLTISYARNAKLEDRLAEASAMSTSSVNHGDLASPNDLQNLEKLRVVFAQIADYKQNGAPLFNTFGIYPGDKLYNAACAAYGNRFRTLLLSPTQANLVQYFASLPPDRRPTDEYTATYRPLRAYLITTSNPEKSSPDLAGDLEKAWVGTNTTIPSATTDLATAQFETYAATLPLTNSCMASLGGAPRMPVVQQARNFLSHFQGIEQVYISMKAAADRKFHSIKFNELYPGSAAYIVDPYEVEGAFTKGGYTFMQDAILHPEPYTSGEEWVLGPATGPGVDRAQLNAQLPPRYLADFLNAWRSYLKAAHVVQGGSYAEAQKKIHELSGPDSAMAKLFQVISSNTAVTNDAYSKPFQAPQSVIPPTAPANAAVLPQGYVAGLGGLDTALQSLGAPGTVPTGAALGAIDTAATAARGAVNTLRSAFVPADPAGNMDTTSEAILLAPIKNAEDLSGSGKAAAAGGGAKALCAQVDALTRKFPFNPDSREDATPAEVATVFAPTSGAIPQFAQTQSSNITLLGQRYIQAQGSTVAINPGFLNFMNAAQTVTTTFFPATKLDFSLTQEPVKNLPPATVDIDGVTLSSAGTPKNFSWTSSPAGKVHVTSGQQISPDYTGPWSLFHFAYGAKHPAPNKLEFIFAMNGQTVNSAGGVPLDFTFDVGGPGAVMLNPAFMRQLHCTTKVATK